jgi:integrase
MLRLQSLKTNQPLPQDVPLDQLRLLLKEIEAEIASCHGRSRRMGLLDRAWVFIMLHSGLRVGEVRHLRLPDLDLEGKKVRIEQSKGLKDRIVCLSTPTVEALHAYLQVRGPAATEHVFLFRHLPLSSNYCNKRLGTYGKRCGVLVRPHQLRHTCATLLLNAGAPILTVQSILGHKFIDTTLGYARLYDGTGHGPDRKSFRWRPEWHYATRQRPTSSLGGCPACRYAQRRPEGNGASLARWNPCYGQR